MLLQPMLKESPDENSLLIITDYYVLVFGFHIYPTSKETTKMFSWYATLFLSTKLFHKTQTIIMYSLRMGCRKDSSL